VNEPLLLPSLRLSEDSGNVLLLLHDQGACATAGIGSEAFFPRLAGAPKRGEPADRLAAAIRICDSCPVKTECSEWADENSAYGVWGGRWRSVKEAILS
jgi:hypothetical protein